MDRFKFLNNISGLILESSGEVHDSEWFCNQLNAKTKRFGKFIKCNNFNKFTNKYDSVRIVFINLPENKAVGTAAMNNRMLFNVEGFSPKLGEPPPKGRVKIEQYVHSFRNELNKLRAKTATPEKILEYLVKYLEKASKVSKNESVDVVRSNRLEFLSELSDSLHSYQEDFGLIGGMGMGMGRGDGRGPLRLAKYRMGSFRVGDNVIFRGKNCKIVSKDYENDLITIRDETGAMMDVAPCDLMSV